MSSLSASPTPADLVITPRDLRFGRDAKQARWWFNGDPVATAFYNALSVTFPRGEAFFIESVKAFRDGVPEKLAGEIRAFVQQEIMHTREHVAFNRKVTESGYDVSRLEAEVERTLAMTAGRPKIVDLAATMALEHYTAILAQRLLKDPAAFAGVDPAWAEMWRWHAIEEIEHKGVAFDTFRHATRDWGRWRRWKLKAITMLLVTINFWPKRAQGMLDLLAQDGITGWRAKAKVAWFLLGTPGELRRLILPWLAYFLPGFHPWAEDDRALIDRYDSAYADAKMPVSAAAEPVPA